MRLRKNFKIISRNNTKNNVYNQLSEEDLLAMLEDRKQKLFRRQTQLEIIEQQVEKVSSELNNAYITREE